MKNKIVKVFTQIGVSALVLLVLNFWLKPAINVHNIGLWIIGAIVASVYVMIGQMFNYEEMEDNSVPDWISIGVMALAWAIVLIGPLASGPMFNAEKHANIAKIEKVHMNDILPSIEDVENVVLMDTESAKQLGMRAFGELGTEYISQFEDSGDYYTCVVNGVSYKVSPLSFTSFASERRNKEIPGYILVNADTNETMNKAEFVEVEGGIKVSPYGYFKNDLIRTVRRQFKAECLGSITFQPDDNLHPYWVIITREYKTAMGCKVPNGCILVDAVTAESTKYSLEDIPTWVDQVWDGEKISMVYNWHGNFANGYWNSLFTKRGCTNVTDDYGYFEKDNTLYVYTGVTSVARDESNLGYICVNTHTGEYSYFEYPSVEEYTAMGTAEEMVANFGYKASFPSLLGVSDEPTYVMVLKDSNGLTKQYAMVNAENHNIVVVGDNLKKTIASYRRSLADSGLENIVTAESKTVTVVIDEILYVVDNGETIVYVKSDNKIFKTDFNENILFFEAGDSITMTYEETGDNIIEIVSFK